MTKYQEQRLALKLLKKDFSRDELNEEGYEVIREWIKDILNEWKAELAFEIEQFGAPYGIAQPS